MDQPGLALVRRRLDFVFELIVYLALGSVAQWVPSEEKLPSFSLVADNEPVFEMAMRRVKESDKEVALYTATRKGTVRVYTVAKN